MHPFKTPIFLPILVSALITGTRIFSYCAEPAQNQSYQAAVEDLSGNRYFPRVLDVLKNAKRSISMAMYVANFDPKNKNSGVNQLVEELVNAHKRQVKVKVILDQNIDFSAWDGGKGEWQKEEKNDPLFVYLKQQGIEVYFDNLFTITHSKLIIVDEETVILGSANWTESSLRKNGEASCLIRSKDMAAKFLEDFSVIPIDYEASILDEERNPPVRLSYSFLTDPSLAPRMLETRDDTAFDLYLLLLKNFDADPQSSIVIDYKTLIPASGLDKKLKYVSARDELKQALRRLEEKYRLIVRKKQFFQNTTVTLLNYPDRTPYSFPQEKYCSVPEAYWLYGWHTAFSFPEKYCYLINLCKGGASRGRLWQDYIVGLSKEFNISKHSLSRGMQGLKKLNIIDMEYSNYSFDEGVIDRDPVRFRICGLYSPQVLSKEKERLSNIYGKEQFEKAAGYAEIVYKGNDLQVIVDIINKIEEYGAAQVDRAFKIVSVKSPGNPIRAYKYVVGILQKEAGKTRDTLNFEN